MNHRGLAYMALSAACLTLTTCVPAGGRGEARLTEAGEYEVYNPSSCSARVYISSDPGTSGHTLGEVPSGGRMVFAVPRRAPGSRIVASALHADGTDCDPGGRIRIRRVGP
jgi:hypothetical protein